MKRPTKRFLFWTPRILALLFALFTGMFALDVFDGQHGFWETAAAFIIHLIPTGILLVALAVAWRWEWVGALLFIGLGGCYAFMAREHPSWILVIGGPAFLVGGLFLLSWVYRAELRAPTSP